MFPVIPSAVIRSNIAGYRMAYRIKRRKHLAQFRLEMREGLLRCVANGALQKACKPQCFGDAILCLRGELSTAKKANVTIPAL
jgi:hypothetical protein